MRKHGECRTIRSPEYICWVRMRQSCYNKARPEYRRYGGRGIGVCKRWRKSFAAFLVDMGRRPGPGYSLDRRNNDKGYSKRNCRWATPLQQARNRSNNRTIGGKTVTELALQCNLGQSTLRARLDRGVPVELATSLPVRKTEKRIASNGKRAAVVARATGIKTSTIYSRLKIGWPIDAATSVPPSETARGRRPTVLLIAKGEKKTLREWSETTGIKENTLRERLRLHPEWPVEKILASVVNG